MLSRQEECAGRSNCVQQPNEELQGTITRISKPIEERGRSRTLYECEYDLSHLPPEEPVTLDLEFVGTIPRTVRAPFVTRLDIDLISVWVLFPPDRPYLTYSLVSYPSDRSVPPEVMNARFTIDHPYGSLIGWSVVNPEADHVYERRWTSE